MSRVLSLRGVRCTYDEPPVTACARVSLTIRRGEFIAIVGPSGSGKSTLLNFIETLDRPISGTVEIDGIDMSRLSDHKLSALHVHLTGFVFRQFHLLEGMNMIDNVADDLLYLGVSCAERRQKAGAVPIRVGLSHRLYHKSHQMSGGEHQRIAITRAVVDDPPLLLANEPTGNLDSVSGASIMELLHEPHEQGTTIIVITHDNNLALQLPRRVAIKDRRIAHGSAAREVAHI